MISVVPDFLLVRVVTLMDIYPVDDEDVPCQLTVSGTDIRSRDER